MLQMTDSAIPFLLLYVHTCQMIFVFTTKTSEGICVRLYLLSTNAFIALTDILNILSFALTIILCFIIFDFEFGASLFMH